MAPLDHNEMIVSLAKTLLRHRHKKHDHGRVKARQIILHICCEHTILKFTTSRKSVQTQLTSSFPCTAFLSDDVRGPKKGHSVLGDAYDTLSHTKRGFCRRGGRWDGVTQILSTGLVGVDLASKVESSIMPWVQSAAFTVVTSISYPWGDFKGGSH